jgi:hypothetical protein
MISPTLISDLRGTSKPKEKQKILKANDCDFLRYLLKSAYEPFEVYHVKIKPGEVPTPGEFDITEPLTRELFTNVIEFCRQSNSNKQNRERIIPILSKITKDTQDLLLGVLGKNWKAGVSTKTIVKVFPELVSRFEVQLANKYHEVKLKKTYKPKSRLCSYKLDGVRCVFLRLVDNFNYADGNWVALSRQGKEFKTVDHLKGQLEALWEMNGVDFWDGELYIPGAEFEIIQGQVMSFTTGTSYDLEYRPFICGDQVAFLNCIDDYPYKVVEDYHTDHVKATQVKAEKQWLITEEQIPEELEKAFEQGYEGIMLRDPDKLYDFKRSDALLKLKESDTAESQEKIEDAYVIDLVISMYPVTINETLVYKDLLTKLIVEQLDGTICTVGSGFNLDFRELCTKDPQVILNKVIEVKFQGYGSKGRMRFPRLYRVREDLVWER